MDVKARCVSCLRVLDVSARPLPSPRAQPRRIEGSVKLSLFHKNNTLTVMVMHVKDLVSTTLLCLLPLPCCLVLGTGNVPSLKSPVVDQERMWPVMVMHVKDLVSTTLLCLLPLPCCLVLGTDNIPCLKSPVVD